MTQTTTITIRDAWDEATGEFTECDWTQHFTVRSENDDDEIIIDASTIRDDDTAESIAADVMGHRSGFDSEAVEGAAREALEYRQSVKDAAEAAE